jgi:hypothetical protein
MGALRCVDSSVVCVDGSVLSVAAVACRDKAGEPYEITLTLTRDSAPFATVGQRCGYQLSELAQRVRAARADPEQEAMWPDPDDRFPVAAGARADAAAGDHEYFTLRSRDRADLPGTGELRCVLRSSAEWLGECLGTGRLSSAAGDSLAGPSLAGQPVAAQPGAGPLGARPPARGRGSWRLSRRAVIEAWGTEGLGVRAVLTSAELVAFLDTVLSEPDEAAETELVEAGVSSSGPASVRGVRRAGMPVGQSAGKRSGRVSAPLWRQRGRVPDGIARSRLPALRTEDRGGASASGSTPARRGDVRR